MEYYLCLILALISFFSAFLSGLVQNVSNEKIMHPSIDAKITETILNLRQTIDKGINPYLIINLLCYLLVPFLLFLYQNPIIIHNPTLFFVIYFFSIITFHLIFYSLGARFSEMLIKFWGSIIILIYNVSYPIILIANKLYSFISGGHSVESSREEISALIESSHETGSLEIDEYRILKNIMKFSSVLVSDIMTPRTVVFNCEADKKVSDVIDLPEIMMYSRFPIWDGDSFDNGVIGYVLSKDILAAALRGEIEKTLREFRRDVYFIPENAELDNALEIFLQRRQLLFVAVDEYGGVEGLLTMEDVMETILGVEIVDEADKIIDLRLYAKQQRDKRIASKVGNQTF